MALQRPILGDFLSGFFAYLLTSAPVWLGIFLEIDFDSVRIDYLNKPHPSFLMACFHFDAGHYARIVERGYAFDPHKRSTVAFFPAYPLLASAMITCTGWPPRAALLVTSNLMLVGVFLLFSFYLRSRCPEDNSHNRLLTLSLFGLWPAGLFFRMPYSESTFLFFTLLVLCGMVRHWPLLTLVLFSGIATASRPVGLAVTAALAWHIISNANRGANSRRLLLAGVCSIAATWGLIFYMVYQYHKFDNPLAFAQTQEQWNYIDPAHKSFGDKVESLLAAEPIWGTYTSDPIRSWKRYHSSANPLFNCSFWNPILFAASLALVLVGAAKAWLSGPEIVLSIGLLGIPYITRAYEMSMASHARFAAVVIPAYIVLGRILGAGPEWLRWCVFGFLSTMLMAWSALFAAGHSFF